MGEKRVLDFRVSFLLWMKIGFWLKRNSGVWRGRVNGKWKQQCRVNGSSTL